MPPFSEMKKSFEGLNFEQPSGEKPVKTDLIPSMNSYAPLLERKLRVTTVIENSFLFSCVIKLRALVEV